MGTESCKEGERGVVRAYFGDTKYNIKQGIIKIFYGEGGRWKIGRWIFSGSILWGVIYLFISDNVDG